MVWGRASQLSEMREKMVASVGWRPRGCGEAGGFKRDLEGKFSRPWGGCVWGERVRGVEGSCRRDRGSPVLPETSSPRGEKGGSEREW